MKKVLSFILAFSLLFSLSACGKNDLKNDTIQNTQGDQAEDLQNKKIVITPDLQNAKFSFTNPSNAPIEVQKTYSENKIAKYEDYTDENITEKTITFLGKEFQNVPYTGSSKNPYKVRDYDTFSNKVIYVDITKSGEIISFFTFTPLNIFPNETQNSVELAKKYLNAIMPDFQYNEVFERKIYYTDNTWYSFRNVINGIPTSESVTIELNSKGELKSFNAYDIGMYDNVEIKGIDKDVYLKKVDEIIKTTYGDTLIAYRIGDDGPVYEIFSNNKLELLVPIEIEIDTLTYQGNPITFGEYIALELN